MKAEGSGGENEPAKPRAPIAPDLSSFILHPSSFLLNPLCDAKIESILAGGGGVL
jgi:hypothetical protein